VRKGEASEKRKKSEHDPTLAKRGEAGKKIGSSGKKRERKKKRALQVLRRFSKRGNGVVGKGEPIPSSSFQRKGGRRNPPPSKGRKGRNRSEETYLPL